MPLVLDIHAEVSSHVSGKMGTPNGIAGRGCFTQNWTFNNSFFKVNP